MRTVTRWAHDRGLPVHHVPGGKRGAIFAFSSEIDAWLSDQNGTGHETGWRLNGLQNSEVPDPILRNASEISTGLKSVLSRPTSWRIGLMILGLVVAGVATSAVLRSMRSRDLQLASVEYGPDTLEGKAADSHTLWVHRYPQPVSTNYIGTSTAMAEGFRISDFLGDGRKEVAAVVPLRSGPNPSDRDLTRIDFFTDTGNLLWSYLPNNVFRFGEHDLKAPWDVQDLLLAQDRTRPTIWVTAAHHTWGNSFVVQLDPHTGQDTLRFVNTGTIRRLSEIKTAHGTYLLAGGFNNEWDSGILAIINENRPFAVSPQTSETRHECASCPKGAPDYYFVFPRSEINQIAHAYEDSVTEIRISEEGIEVTKQEALERGRESTLYLLRREPPFSVVSLRYNSDYDRIHRSWSSEEKLTHSLENCPERMHPQPVRLWTVANGWADVPVKPAKANQ